MMKSSNKAISGFIAATLLCAASGPALSARDGQREDRTDRIDQNTQRDLDRAQQRATEDAARDVADRQDRAAKEAEDRAKDAADAQERAAKDAADAAEQAAKDAEDAAEDAAKEAAEAAEDNRGSSDTMQDLAESENPEKDDRGFPVRRGEIVALDMSDAALAKAQAQGFAVIERTPLAALDSIVTRLSAPKDMDAQTALAAMRGLDAGGSYDLTHYYAMEFAPQGSRTATATATATKAKMPSSKGSLKIGMIDTKVADHVLLSNISLQQRDFSNAKDSGPSEHGTAIASLLSADGAGRIYAASIFRGSVAKPYTSADAIVRALNWMVEQNVVVINISLAGPRNKILDELVARTIGKGHIIVAAAGNGGPTAPPAYPAALPNVVAVTAIDRKLKVYRYANQGRYITVSARGVDVTAAAPGGGSSSYSGTSFATPHIAAWMARCAKSLSAASRKKCIASLEKSAKDLGAPGKDAVYGLGYIS